MHWSGARGRLQTAPRDGIPPHQVCLAIIQGIAEFLIFRLLSRAAFELLLQVNENGESGSIAQIGSLEDVRYAVLETSGKVSFVTASSA